MKDVLEFAIQLAEKAGHNTLQYFDSTFEVISKADNSPVTIADRSTEELLRTEIEKHFPDDGIVGEEFGIKEGKSGIRWILDPIDGTKSFIRNVPLYGTMIAVEQDGEPLIGVIRFPPLQRTLSALKGHGCYMNGHRCQVSQNSDLAKSSLMMSVIRDCAEVWGPETFMNILNHTSLQRTWGDCYGYYLVATGKVDMAMDPKMHIWDVAPLIPIIEEAGGKLTNSTGERSLDITNTIATNGILHEAMLALFSK